LRGWTEAIPFLKEFDLLHIIPSAESGVLASLVRSRFEGIEWIVRENSAHSKSRTYTAE
jgi:hypothetical protein